MQENDCVQGLIPRGGGDMFPVSKMLEKRSNNISGANAGGPRQLALRTHWATRVAELVAYPPHRILWPNLEWPNPNVPNAPLRALSTSSSWRAPSSLAKATLGSILSIALNAVTSMACSRRLFIRLPGHRRHDYRAVEA
jgi:hypothetical protein